MYNVLNVFVFMFLLFWVFFQSYVLKVSVIVMVGSHNLEVTGEACKW